MILWEAFLVTTAATLVMVNGRVTQQAISNTGLVKEEEHQDVDDAGIQHILDKGMVREQSDMGVSVMADSDDLDNNLLGEQHDLDDAGISMDKTGLSRNPEQRSLLDLWESILGQNKSCTPTVSCSHAGGFCFSSGSKCNGTIDAYGCIGGRCMCCILVAISPVLTTTANVTDTTAAPTTTPIVTTSTIITTTPNGNGTTAAPTTLPIELECRGGFLLMNQCFKIFNDTTRTWQDAIAKCQSENLILAEPSDSIAAPLREYVLNNYGTGDYQCWLGARGDGSKFVCQHSGKSLFNNNTLWDYGYLNSGLMSTSYCLELDALQSQFASKPEKPYDAVSCTSSRWTLCQGIEPHTTQAPSDHPTTQSPSDPPTTQPPTTLVSDTPTSTSPAGCGGVYTSSSGRIRHPLSGSSYQNNENCVWTIMTGDLIKITVTSFDLETNYDYLFIRDGNSTYSSMLGRFTGSSIPTPLQANSGAAYLSFSSDGSVTRAGFELQWETLVTTSTIIITTPNENETTAAPTTLSTGCQGGFLLLGQCFKMFTDIERTWANANTKCSSENLILAEPSDSAAVPLRKYVLNNYGTGNHQCWLGARGEGSKFLWQHSRRSLLRNNTLWDSTGPLSSSYMSNSYCLELDALQGEWAAAPGKPYDCMSCTTRRWTLCEDVSSTIPSTSAVSATTIQDTTSTIMTPTTIPAPITAAYTTTTTDSTSIIPSPTTLSSSNTTSEIECTGGFLIMNHCFKIFSDTRRRWQDAIAKCQSENLILAEPSDSVAAPLREYVLNNYGDYECWLGARGDGNKFVFQHSGKSLFNNNTLWDSGYLNSGRMSTSYCLELDALQSQFASHPEKPYDAWPCTSSRWTLCQGIEPATTQAPTDFPTTHSSSDPPTTQPPTTLVSDPPTTTTPSGCGGVYTSSRGRIRHPLSGSSYQNNENCGWTIITGDPIKITVISFHLETNYDYLYIRDGNSTNFPVLGRFTGSSHPSPVQANSGAAYLLFTSDGSVTKTGFVLQWDTLDSSTTQPPTDLPTTQPPTTIFSDSPTTTPSDTTSGSLNLRWLSIGSDRFIRFDQKLNWTDARNLCINQGLDLYTPRNTSAVSKYLADNFSNGRSMWHWLGGRGNGTHMVWVTGDVLTSDDPWYISSGGYYTHVGTDACLWTITNSGWVESGKGVLNTQNDSCSRDVFYVVCG